MAVSKDKAYNQVVAGAVQPWAAPSPCNFGCPLRFAAYVIGGDMALLPAPVLSGPVNTGAIGSAWNGGVMGLAGPNEWRLGNGNWDYNATQAGLDAVFPNGTYTVKVAGKDVALSLAGDAYPNAPVLTFSGGAWIDGAYVINPTRTLIVSTNAFDGYGAHRDGRINLYVGGSGANVAGVVQYHSSSPSPNQSSVTIPPGTLVDGREYYAGASFAAIVDDNASGVSGAQNVAEYRAITNARIRADASFTGGTPSTPPVFPMTVRTNITPAAASASADIQFRPQDVGTSGSVYAFAVAPQGVLKAAGGEAPLVVRKSVPANGKDTPVACVLAQLNASGQLQAVSASQLQAYVTGVLSAQGQAVTILDNVPTTNVAGATFYVGYGTSGEAMINSGVNRSAVTVPGTQTCQPQPPQTGWWWNAAEDGRGYTIESTGSKIFFAAYLYDISGRSTWYIAAGPTSLDGSLFVGNLESYSNGQTLTGAFRSPVRPPVLNGQVTLAFNDSTHGTMVWPGGTVPITRMEFGVGGVNAVPQANQPENGWWLSGLDDGRGFFIEWQAGVAFMAGFMYDDTGAPVWYIAAKPRTDNAQAFSSNWEKYVNGQTLTGAYRPPTRPPTLTGAATIQFQGAETAIMTMPGGRQVNLSRYRF
ncbi:MAG: hypothetical protein FIB05_07155 [Betaproteobacteria bacterium]|nr:hypothetical protein [Betaproteobacteria bacterium]